MQLQIAKLFQNPRQRRGVRAAEMPEPSGIGDAAVE
jgi:hypothetical protein